MDGYDRSNFGDAHEGLRLAFIRALEPYAHELSPEELLAIAAQLVGKLMMCQGPDMSRDECMTVVHINIIEGCRQAVDMTGAPKGRA